MKILWRKKGEMSPSRLAWLALVALGFCAVTNMASAALLDGVISAWTFNDFTANDLFNRNNGQYMDGAYQTFYKHIAPTGQENPLA
ncbi:hypothetical protein HYR99_13725 [Candidatus Poribacteria bacterium]|nr:hypothetical protein [Candidatus Poribacteria bacterium]